MRTISRRRSVNRTDLVSGLFVVLLSGGFALEAFGHGIGTFARMGAGFYPFVLGALCAAFGLGIAVRAVIAPTADEASVRWRGLLFICAAFATFGLLIEPAGLVAAIVGSTVIGAMADPESRLWESLLLGLGLSAGIWLIFVVLLGLSIPVLPLVL